MPVAEMLVNKQPSVAITIQKEYSYFSGINLSFLTHRNQSDYSQCINLHPSNTPGQLQHLELIIDLVVDPLWGGQGGAGCHLPLWGNRAVGLRVDSGGALGGSAPETLGSGPLLHFHLEASVWLKSYSTWKAQSTEHTISDLRLIRHRPVSMSAER